MTEESNEAGNAVTVPKELLSDLQAEAAASSAFRKAFRKAVESYPPSCPMPEAVQKWWDGLYQVVASSTAGLALLATTAQLQEEVRQLKAEVEALKKGSLHEAMGRVTEAVIGHLRHVGIEPHCDWYGHSIDQVVGTEVAALLGEIARLRALLLKAASGEESQEGE